MQQVVSGHVVQPCSYALAAIGAEYASDRELDNEAAHLSQEFRDWHRLLGPGRRGFAQNNRMLAVGFKRRAGGGPKEVRSTDVCIPEPAHLFGDIGAHLRYHGPVIAGPSRRRTFP